MRFLLAALCLILASQVPAQARSDAEGVWLFDGAPSYPGVTMLEVADDAGAISGSVTTEWYGPMSFANGRIEGDTLTFDLRNINDKAHPTRRWTARFTPSGVKLTGDIWHAHVEQDGRRGGIKDAETRAFRFGPALPPLDTIALDKLAATPPMGWSSWNKFGDRIDDATIRAMADTLVATGLRDAGYLYVNIDDGWQGKRDANGVLQPNKKFPDMRALTDYVHSKGLKIGIYTSQGPRTCAGYEGSYGHIQRDAQTFADWGFDYLKHDLCSGEWFYDDADKVKRSYYEMGLALKATGRSMLYSLCQYGRFNVSEWGRSVGGHLWRTTGDITDDYKTMSDIGFERNPKFGHAGPGGWNDPDMLEVGNGGMSEDEYITHLTLWAIQAAPLIMGHDLRQTSDNALRVLKNRDVIAIDQDVKGVQGRAVRKDGKLEVWRKELADGSVALALFNRGDAPARMAPTAADADLGRLTEARDLWRGVAVAVDDLHFDVPAHGAVMLRVKGESI